MQQKKTPKFGFKYLFAPARPRICQLFFGIIRSVAKLAGPQDEGMNFKFFDLIFVNFFCTLNGSNIVILLLFCFFSLVCSGVYEQIKKINPPLVSKLL
jgi:hypothetical protein